MIPAIAGAAVSSIMGGIMSMGQNAINNQYASQMSSQARKENYMYGELAADAADKRTRALYNDLYSPEALLRQYEKAGLSPSMMFGGTPGQGGMQGAHGTGAQGIPNLYTPLSLVDAAQAAALFAQAQKTTAETEIIEPLTESEIAKNLADSGHAEAAKAMLQSQKTGQDLQNYITEKGKEASIYQICALAEKAGYDAENMYNLMRTAKVMADIDEATYQTQVDTRLATLNNIISSTAKNDKDIEKVQLDMKQMIYNWDLEYRKLDVQEQQQKSYAEFVTGQLENERQNLVLKAKQLGIEETGMWVHAITDTLKDVALGAMAVSSVRGAGGTGKAIQQATRTTKTVKFNKTSRGLNLEKNKYTYPY